MTRDFSHFFIKAYISCIEFQDVLLYWSFITFPHDEWPGVMQSEVSYAAIPRHFTEGKVLENLVKHGIVHVTASKELFPEGQSYDLAVWNV